MSEDGHSVLPHCGDAIDADTFEQVLEMDDDDNREFSREIVFGFFEQAEQTFNDMESGIEEKDLEKLSQLGHYLKGSSATLGLNKVRDSCEKIQHLGQLKDEEGNDVASSEDENLSKIATVLVILKEDYRDAEMRLRAFYHGIS